MNDRVLVICADRTSSGGFACNLGDAFLTDVLVTRLNGLGFQVDVVDFGPAQRVGGSRRRIDRLGGLVSAFRASTGVIVGGGTMLQDDTGRPLTGLPRLVLAASVLGWLTGRQVVFLGVGCDPITSRLQRSLVRLAVWRRHVWVRDEASLIRVQSLSPRSAALSADVSLWFDAGAARRPIPGRSTLVLALNRRDVAQIDETFLAAARGRYDRLVFLQMDQDDRNSDAAGLPESMASQFDEITAGLDWQGALDHVGGCDLLIASRMHALYASALLGSRAIAIGDSAKITAFCAEFGITRFRQLDVAALDADPSPVDGQLLARARARLEAQLPEVVSVLTGAAPKRDAPP